jgi:threonyl-tRNA synthetase
LVAGDKEVESETLAVRTRNGEDMGSMTMDAFVELLETDIAQRGREQ